jgi:hypothetical protein
VRQAEASSFPHLHALLHAKVDTDLGTDWSIRGRDPIVRDPRIFSNHVFRQHGDAVLAGFTELRAIAVSEVALCRMTLTLYVQSEAMDELSFGHEHAASEDVSRRLLSEFRCQVRADRSVLTLVLFTSYQVSGDC